MSIFIALISNRLIYAPDPPLQILGRRKTPLNDTVQTLVYEKIRVFCITSAPSQGGLSKVRYFN